ncbi:membrane protein insertion efficiency factor YidD [uncultured Rothia sp.]|uniref:membrane protein insertion efficiency factor YidD n=1 Tax=uncultured Rothia sp. TaxID=316088 RepID=UPI00288938E5|nr:membrane protein insertion efficiency factor YidD [uncultured Rothia sp.]
MSHSRCSHREERFHVHHSGTYSASAETLGPDELLALAPNEFVRPETFLQALYVLPQNLLIACMKAYRKVVSPLYGDVCRYYPTCSAYALEALTTHGAMGGLSLTVRRILRCVPWATGGIDPVPEGKRTFAPGAEPKIILLNHPHLYTPHTGGDARPE